MSETIRSRAVDPEVRAAVAEVVKGVEDREATRPPKARPNTTGRRFVRSVLAPAATSLHTGEKLYPEDRKDFIDRVMKDAETAPPRIKAQLRLAAEECVAAIESGDRMHAVRVFDAAVDAIGDQLPSTFQIPSTDN
jgi:hypothetical protein